MLIQLLTQHPQALTTVISKTPLWVGGLLLALLALGLSQTRDRQISPFRLALTPLAMNGLSLWGNVAAFGKSPLFAEVMLAWAASALLTGALMMRSAPPAGTRYDPASRRFSLPGSWLPLLLILGILLTKYIVGVDLAMQAALAHDGPYTLGVATLYGIFSGIFAGRAIRLWRLARRPLTTSSLVNT